MMWPVWLMIVLTIISIIVSIAVYEAGKDFPIERDGTLFGIFMWFLVVIGLLGFGMFCSTPSYKTTYEVVPKGQYTYAKTASSVTVDVPGVKPELFTDTASYLSIDKVPCVYIKRDFNAYDFQIEKRVLLFKDRN